MLASHPFLTRAVADHQAGHLHRAAAGYRMALSIDPADPNALHLLGVTERGHERPTGAERLMQRALTVAPALIPACFNLARLYNTFGRLDEAEALLRRVWSLSPSPASALALASMRLERGRGAVAAARSALALDPGDGGTLSLMALALNRIGAEDGVVLRAHARASHAAPDRSDVWLNRSAALLARGQAEGARRSAALACVLAPGEAGALVNHANALQTLGRLGQALSVYEAAVAVDPLRAEARMGLTNTLSRLVPQWHAPMMNDAVRNDAYDAALRRATGPETHVLEIGTGAGLLALMAAAAGAKRVTTCEMVPAVAAAAADIVAANGMAGRITVIPRRSDAIDADSDLEGRADVLVSEILSSELLSEGVLPSLEDAHARLLKPGGTVIPRAGSLRCALVGGRFLEDHFETGTINGFDVRRFRRLVARRAYLPTGAAGCTRLSAVFEPFRFDLTGRAWTAPDQRRVAVPVTGDGRCLGVLQWIRLEMDAHTTFENDPADRQPVSGWQPVVYLFDAPVAVRAGQTVMLQAWHNRNQPWFMLDGVA